MKKINTLLVSINNVNLQQNICQLDSMPIIPSHMSGSRDWSISLR